MVEIIVKTTPRQHLHIAKQLALFLDGAFVIPGTRRTIGLDPLLGILPVAGDLISFAISLYIIVLARQLGMGKGHLLLMLFNIGLDTAIGAIPFLGDLFDVFWKGNLRNVALMEAFVARLEHQELLQSASTVAGPLPPGTQTIDVAPEHPRTDRF